MPTNTNLPFPEFPSDGEWGNLPTPNHGKSTNQNPPENAFPDKPNPAHFSEPSVEQSQANQLIAEELHPRDQEQILMLFPCIAAVQRRVAARDFCQFQQLKISKA